VTGKDVELTQHQMVLRARGRSILEMMSSVRDNARQEFVNRDFNAAINIRRCVVLETGLEELRRSKFVGQPLKFEIYREKMNPIGVGRSKTAGRRLCIDSFMHAMVAGRVLSTEHISICDLSVATENHPRKCLYIASFSNDQARRSLRTAVERMPSSVSTVLSGAVQQRCSCMGDSCSSLAQGASVPNGFASVKTRRETMALGLNATKHTGGLRDGTWPYVHPSDCCTSQAYGAWKPPVSHGDRFPGYRPRSRTERHLIRSTDSTTSRD
jgi:hypothetical protein